MKPTEDSTHAPFEEIIRRRSLIGVVAIAAAWFSRGEQATGAQIVGGALILGGLATMRLGRSAVGGTQRRC